MNSQTFLETNSNIVPEINPWITSHILLERFCCTFL